MTVFFRILEASVDQKPSALLQAVATCNDATEAVDSTSAIYAPDPAAFAFIPGSPFAYWAGTPVVDSYRRFPSLERDGIHAGAGAQTRDNFRFIRACWEVPDRSLGQSVGWVPLAKGGAHARFYYDVHLLVRWAQDGRELKAATSAWRASKGWGDYWRAAINSVDYYFRPGLTWPARTTSGFSIRCMPAGCVFGHKGPSIFVPSDTPEVLLALAAVLNAVSFSGLVAVQLAAADAAARSYEVGVIQNAPMPELHELTKAGLAGIARRAWSLKRSLDTTNETSHAFLLPEGINESVTGLDRASVEHELDALQRQIDDKAFDLYGIGLEDRAAMRANAVSDASVSGAAKDPDDEDIDDEGETDSPVGGAADAMTSWLAGVAFGRFDPRLATGERPIPPEPEPFDALPARAPGMYHEGEEPADRPDILVDDEGHADDLAARVVAIADRVRIDVPESLRGWLAKEFFPLHIKMYSKSRRKAPIYWQLATPSASYSVWLYIHAFSKDTLFRMQNDYAAPKLAHEERRLESLISEIRDGATAAQRKALAAQEAFVGELRAFLDEVKLVAPLWNPNLDDGVIINFAPLWRLVPQNKAWQKELRTAWDALCDGKYDWAHLAMHHWPERVVPKCAQDRSLAIAHGLEDAFWIEGTDGKWTARETPTRSVVELVRERTSPAVKSALKNLLDAPAATGNSGRGRVGRRKAASQGGNV